MTKGKQERRTLGQWRRNLLAATSLCLTGALAVAMTAPARATVRTIENGGVVDLLGGVESRTGLALIDGQLINGDFAASESFDVRSGLISARLFGFGSLTKSTSGTVTLSGANAFSGGSEISAGTLRLESNTGLGMGTLVATGGILDLAIGLNVANIIEMQALGFAVNVDPGTATLSGIIREETGSFGINKTGGGNLRLTGANTFTGLTTVEAGELTITGAGLLVADVELIGGAFLTFDKSGGYTYDKVVQGTGRLSATSGPLTLTQSQSLFDSFITINSNASIILGSSATLGGASNAVEIHNAGTLDLGGTTQNLKRVDLFGVDSLAQGGILDVTDLVAIDAGSITANIRGTTAVLKEDATGLATLSGNNTYTGATTINLGTLLALNGRAIGDRSAVTVGPDGILKLGADEVVGSLAGAGNVELESYTLRVGPDDFAYDTTFSGLIAGTGTLHKDGAGKLTLTNQNDHTGGTKFAGGTLRVEHAGALGVGQLQIIPVVTSLPESVHSILSYADGIVIGNSIELGSNIAKLSVDAGDEATQNNTISENTTGRPVTKIGGGKLTFSVVNAYTGETRVNAGTLALSGTGTLGTAGSNVSVASGATLDLTNTTQTVGTLTLTDNANVIGKTFGSFPLGTLLATTIDVSTGAGTTALIETFRLNADTINKNGAGTLTLDTLSGPGSSGVIELNDGTLKLGWQGVLGTSTVNAYDNTQISYFRGGQNHFNAIVLKADTVKLTPESGVNIVQHGVISDEGNDYGLEIVTDTAFMLTADNTYTGVTTITGGGTLYLGLYTSTGSVAGDIALTGGSLGILRTDTALDVAGVISGAGGVFTDGEFIFDPLNPPGEIVAGKWTLSGNNTYSGGTTVNAGTLRAGSATAFGTGSLNTNNSALNAPGSIATISLNGFDISAPGLSGNGVFDLGGKTLTIAGPGGFLNGATFTAGDLTVSASGNQAISGVDLSPIATLAIDGRVDIQGSGNVAPQSIVLGAAGHLDFEFLGDAEYVAAGISGSGTIFLDDSRVTLGTGNIIVSLASEISGTGGSLKKTGTGVLTLSGNNSFDGGILLEQGTLRLASSGAAGLGVIHTTGSVIDYATNVNNAADILLDSDTTQLRYQSGNFVDTATQSGDIGETGGARPLEKTGDGILILTGTNTYTGLTTVSGGRLELGGNGSIASDIFVANNGSFFDFNLSTDYTYTGVISGGNVTQIGTGTTTLTGPNTNDYYGISQGTLKLDGAGTLGDGDATFGISSTNGDATLDLGGSSQTVTGFTLWDLFGINPSNNVVTNGDLTVTSFMNVQYGTISANLHGASGLTKTGNETVTLSGTNTFTGPVTLNAGTLVLQNGSAIDDGVGIDGFGGVLRVDNAETIFSLSGAFNTTLNETLTINGSSATGYSGVMSGGGGLVHSGPGSSLELAGANTYTGGTIINGGTIVLGGANGEFVGDVAVASGAKLEFNRSNPLNFEGVISGAGTVRQNNPTGAITLTGANTLTGAMIVSNGTLAVSGAGTFGDGASVELQAVGSGVVVDLGGTSQSVFLLAVGSGAAIQGAGGSALSVVDSIQVGTGSIAVDLSGAAGLFKFTGGGADVFTLSGNNTFTGATTVTSGTLVLQGGSALADTNAVTVSAGATLQLLDEELIGSLAGAGTLAIGNKRLDTGFDNTDTVWTGTVTGGSTSGLQKYGTGKFTVTGDLNQETTSINAGEIAFNGTAAGSMFVNSGGRLSGTHTINGNLSVGPGGVLAPGNSPGITTVLGDYTGGGTLEVEVQFDNAGAPVNGVTHDFLNIAGNVLGAPTAVNILTFAPSTSPAATVGNGIEIVRVGGASAAGDFTMTSYLLGSYYYDIVHLPNYSGSLDGFFLQSSLATPGCVVDGLDNACFIDDAANTIGAAVDALAGNDTLQLTGATDFTFDVARIGTTYTNFEVFQKADTNTVTLSGVAGFNTLGFDVQNGTLIAGSNQLGSLGRVNIFTPGTLQLASALTVGSIAGSGDIALGGSKLTAGGDNTSTLFSGVISGTGDFDKQGSGTLTLSGANTFSGTLSLNEGRIDVTGAGQLGAATAGLFVQGTLDLGGTAQTVGSLFLGSGSIQGGSLIVNGDAGAQVGTISADLTVTGTLSVPFSFGSLTLSGNNTLTNVLIGAGDLFADGEGAITDTASVNLAWSGIGFDPRLKLLTNQTVGSVSSDALGAIDLGALALTTGGNNASTTFAGGIFGAGGKLIKTGTGTFTLSANNSFTGGIDLMAGTLRLANNGAAGTGPITTFGSVIDYAAAINNAAPIVLNSSTTQLQVSSGVATQSGVISELGGARPLEKTGAGNLVLTGASTYTGLTTVTNGRLQLGTGGSLAGNVFVGPSGNAWFDFASNGNVTYSGVLSGGQVSKQNAGTTTWTGANTHSYTGISGGTLLIGSGGTLGASNATFGISGSAGVATLDLGGTAQTISMFRMFNGFDNAIVNGDLTITSQMFAEAGTISANLHGAGTLIKNTAGTTTLSGANTYTGQTTINGGTLILSGGAALADASDVVVNTNGALQLNANESIGTLSGGGAVALNSNTLTVSGFNSTFSGVIAGSGGLTKTGPSTLLLTGANSYTGLTVVSSGRIQLGDGGALAGNVNVASSGSNTWFEFANSSNLTFGGSIAGGQVGQVGAGTTTLTGVNTNSYLSVSGGTLTVAGSGTFGASDATILVGYGSTQTLDIGGGTQNIGQLIVGPGVNNSIINGTLNVASNLEMFEGAVSANLSGTAGLTKQQSGIVTLSGNNTFTGLTSLSVGTLVLQGGSAIADNNAVSVVLGATLQLDNSETIGSLSGNNAVQLGSNALTTGGNNTNTTYSGTFAGTSTSQLIKTGSGTFSITSLGHAGQTIINGGELNFNGTAAGSVTVNDGGRLSGNSTINGNLTLNSGGVLATGNSPGITNVLGNFAGGGALDVEVQFNNVAAPDNGTTHDFLNIAGNVTGGTTTINLLTFAPSGLPAATVGDGVELVRVGGTSNVEDFFMEEYLLGDYFYNLVYLANYEGSRDSFFLQSTLAVPGCAVTTENDACFIDAATDQSTAINALAGTDVLQLTGAVDFDFNVGAMGTTFASFEQFQKAGTSTVTLTGTTAVANLGVDVQNGILIAGTGQLGALGEVTIFTPGILQTTGNLQTGSLAGTGTLEVQAGEFQTGANNASTNFSGAITGDGDFQKTGTGTLTLSGTNTLSGYTSIIGGTLEVDGGAAINDLSRVILDPAGTLRLLTDETIGSLEGTLVSGGNVDLGAHRLTLGGNNFGTYFTGILSGTGGLTVTGSPFAGITLGGANTFTGSTIIDGSQVTLAGPSGALAGGVQLLNDGRLTFARGTDYTYGGAITGDGTVRIVNDATTTWTGANTFSGTLQMRDGILALAPGAVLGATDLFVDFFGVEGISLATLDLGGTTQTIGGLKMFGGTVENGTLNFLTVSLEEGEISANLIGAGTVTKSTSGTFTLSGANTYSGATNILGGTMIANGGAAIGDASAVTVAAGATFQLGANETVGSIAGAGAVTLGANALTAGGDNSSTLLSGVVSGLGGKLIKTGAGMLTLSGNNSFSGGIDILLGGVSLASNTAAGTGPITTFGSVIDYANGVNIAAPIIVNSTTTQLQVLAGVATQAGNMSELGGQRPLEKIGAGELILSGSNSWSGATTISQGTLTAQGGAAIGDLSAVTVTGGATFQLGANETVGSIAGPGAVTLGANAITIRGNGASTILSGVMSGLGGRLVKEGTGSLILTNSNTYTGGTTVNGGFLYAYAIGSLGTGNVAVAQAGRLRFDLLASAQSLGITSDGLVVFFGNSTAANANIINTGIDPNNFSNSSLGLGFHQNASAGQATITNSGSLGFYNQTTAASANITHNSGVMGFFNSASAGSATIINNASAPVFGQRGLGFFDAAAAGVGNITNNGDLAFFGSSSAANSILTNYGRLAFSDSSTAGNSNVTVAAGLLAFSNTASAGTATITLSGSSTLDIAGMTTGGLSINTLASTSSLSLINLGANTLTLGGSGTNTTVAALVQGVGGITKTSNGTLTLSGANTYFGETYIEEGTLIAQGGAAIGDLSAVTMEDGATLLLSASETVGSLAGMGGVALGVNTLTTGVDNTSTTFAGVISGAGGVTKTGTGAFVLSGANTFSGPVAIQGGTLVLQGGVALIDAMAVDISTGAALQLLNSETLGTVTGAGAIALGGNTLSVGGTNASFVFMGQMSGAGGLTKLGSGTMTLSGLNTYSGATALSAGTLTLSGGGAIGDLSALSMNAGTTLNLGDAETIGSLSGTGVVALGANTLTTGGNNATTSFAGVISGAGGLAKTGTGVFTLTGANTYSGQTSVLAGSLVAGSAQAFGTGSALFVDAGGAASLGDFNTTIGAIGGAGQLDIAGVTLTTGAAGSSLFSGNIVGSGGKIAKTGAGILTLAGNNTFSGGIDILQGGISLQSNTAAGTGPITTFGSIIDYANGVNIATPIILSSNDTQLRVLVGAATQSGAISEVGGSRPLEKIGVGNLTLSGANSFTGIMTVTDGTLTVSGGSALSDSSPTIVASTGTLAVASSETIGALSGSGALNLSSGATLTTGGNNTSTIFAGSSSGAGGMTKTGSGTFLLTGANSFSGLLNVAGGTLTVTPGGSLANMSLNVGAGASARLGASSLGVNGGGTVGTSMGALSVAAGGSLYLDDNTDLNGASVTLASGSSLGVFLTTDTTTYAHINVSGTANIGGDLGVYLDPVTFGGTTATAFTYDNVISGASRAGTFGSVNLLQTSNSLFSVAAIYGTNDVDLQVTRSSFAGLGGPGGNQNNVGGAIETIFVSGTSNPDILNLINTVAGASPADILILYSNVSGSLNAEVEAAGFRTDDPWKQTVAERVNAARAPGCTVAGDTWCLRRYAQAASPVMSDVQGDPSAFDWLQTGIREDGTTSAWMRAVGAWAEADSSLNAPGSTQWTGGVIGGLDRVFDSLLLAGVAGQYLETNVDFDKSTNKSNVKAVQLGSYLSYGGAEAYVNANVSVIGSTAKSERRLTVGALNYDIDSFLRSWTYTFAAEAGTIIEEDGFRFEPSFALNFQHGKTGDYTESNGGGLALRVRPDEMLSLRSILTARLSQVIDIGDRKIVPQIKVDWRHEMLDRGQGFNAAFTGAPDVWFKVDGTEIGRDTFTLGAAITMPIAGRVTGYVDAQGSMNEDVVSGMASVGVRATW
jgi:fibronectin-binding autotransporter adhesin